MSFKEGGCPRNGSEEVNSSATKTRLLRHSGKGLKLFSGEGDTQMDLSATEATVDQMGSMWGSVMGSERSSSTGNHDWSLLDDEW